MKKYKHELILGRINAHVCRLAQLTFVMLIGIGALVALEAMVLWGLGIQYAPRMSIRAVVWNEFVIDDSGRWAASRISYHRESAAAVPQHSVLLHDMSRPNQPHYIAVSGYPQQLAIASRADLMAVACYDGSIYVGSYINNLEPLGLLAHLPRGCESELTCSPDGKLLAATDRTFLYVWQFPQRKLLAQIRHQRSNVKLLRFSGDGAKLLAVGVDGELSLWRPADGKLLSSFQSKSYVRKAVLSDDGRRIEMLTTGTTNGSMRRLTMDLGTGEVKFSESRIMSPTDCPTDIAADGSLIATLKPNWDNGFSVDLWHAQTGELLGELTGGAGVGNGLCFVADGTLMTWDTRGVLSQWDINSLRLNWRFCGFEWAKSEPALQLPPRIRERRFAVSADAARGL
jgi:WD40 repeat protein